MRVSQIQNLAWAGNVLVLAGLGWVGWQFWQVKNRKPEPPPAWEKVKGVEDPNAKRWPGDLSAFSHIVTTIISGKVPPPPPPPVPQAPPDPVAEFRNSVAYLGGMESPNDPVLSTARIKYQGKEISVQGGQWLGRFQFKGFTEMVQPDRSTIVRLVFRHPDTGADFTIDQKPPKSSPLTDSSVVPFKPGTADAVKDGRVSRDSIPLTPFQASDGTWVIPSDTQVWIETFGEADLWAKLSTEPDVDAKGVSHGLRIKSAPEAQTPLQVSPGIGKGDVVRSINGVPVRSKEDIVLYLRGDGKGLERYEVVVDNGGKERTVVYRVPRRR